MDLKYEMYFQVLKVCPKAWMLCYGVPVKAYYRCRAMFMSGAMSTHSDRNQDSSKKVYRAIQWFRKWATFHGDRMPHKKEVWLPYRTRTCEIFAEYEKEMEKNATVPISRSSFYKILKTKFSDVKVKKVKFSCDSFLNFYLHNPVMYRFFLCVSFVSNFFEQIF